MAEPGSRDARAEMLGRISAALGERPRAEPVPREYRRQRHYPDVVGLFAERVADYRAQVRRVSEDELAAAIAECVGDRASVVIPADLPEAWQVGGVRWLAEQPADVLSVAELDAAAGVLTGCAVAIAETGTIVLDGGARQGRRALTLVPDYHLCVVFTEQIVATVPEALARVHQTRPLTFVSGPSATSDIELSRVEGVHGPRTLHVLVVDAGQQTGG